MTRDALVRRISIDPNVCFGKPCIRGTRLWVSLILDLLASGMSETELLDEYPQLAREDVLAALAFGAEMAGERYVEIPNRRIGVKFTLDSRVRVVRGAVVRRDGGPARLEDGRAYLSRAHDEMVHLARGDGERDAPRVCNAGHVRPKMNTGTAPTPSLAGRYGPFPVRMPIGHAPHRARPSLARRETRRPTCRPDHSER